MTNGSIVNGEAPDVRRIAGELEALRHDVAALVKAVASAGSAHVAPAESVAGQRLEDVRHSAELIAAVARNAVRSAGRHLQEQPALLLLMAFAVGAVGARLLRR